MYWNNSWVNFFNNKNYFNKVLFFENIFYFLFSDKLFRFFFKTPQSDFYGSKLFKNFLLKKKNKVKRTFFFFKKRKKKKVFKFKRGKYHFTRLWFIKYNNYILISTFVYFYFRVKKKKKTRKNIRYLISKTPAIFWKKKRGFNFKKKLFIPQLNKLF